VHVGFFGNGGLNGAQAEALRIPFADGTLFPIDVDQDDALMPSVGMTAHHDDAFSAEPLGGNDAAEADGTVANDGGRHTVSHPTNPRSMVSGAHDVRERVLALAKDFGATDIVTERDAEGIEKIRQLTNGFGAHAVLECVGTDKAMATAVGIARAGGAIGRVGVPHYETVPSAQPLFYKNIMVGGGPAPVRAYIEQLLPDVLEGRINPGRVFDRTVNLDGVPDGYRAMNDRESIKVLVRP